MPNPYNYHFDYETQSYRFTTKNAIGYKVVFVVDGTFAAVSGLEIKNVYQFIIEKESDEPEHYDPRVSDTIKDIVGSFFQNSRNSMIYICDDGDFKAAKRFRAFDRWYQRSTLTATVSKLDNVIVCDSNGLTTTLYSSLLYHNDNVNKDSLVEIYNTIQEVLNEK